MYDLKTIASRFRIRGEYLAGQPYGSGHINDTFAVRYRQDGSPTRYILQRVNHSIFTRPAELMANIERVTGHLRDKLHACGADDVCRRTLTIVPTSNGDSFLVDEDGNYWRVYLFIESARTFDQVETAKQAFEAARAFGRFQNQLSDLPPPRLTETIPAFHDTRGRFDALWNAVDADPCNRAASVKREIDFTIARESLVDVLANLQREGRIPERITHNDTKLNNVMIDDATGEGICVIDLDTVMPGLALYDFGDMVRSATRPTPEDETDLGRVEMRMDLFEALTRGYLSATGDVLNATEKDCLVFSAKLITFEIGIRFLTDYLLGDVYFKTRRAGHNLDRCNVQFKMVESLEANETDMQRFVRACR